MLGGLWLGEEGVGALDTCGGAHHVENTLPGDPTHPTPPPGIKSAFGGGPGNGSRMFWNSPVCPPPVRGS